MYQFIQYVDCMCLQLLHATPLVPCCIQPELLKTIYEYFALLLKNNSCFMMALCK